MKSNYKNILKLMNNQLVYGLISSKWTTTTIFWALGYEYLQKENHSDKVNKMI